MTNDLRKNTASSTLTETRPRPSWDEVWVTVADTIATRSRCSRAQVGCVLVDENQNVLAMSYNGPPPNYEVEGSCINWCPRAQGLGGTTSDYSNCPSNHAEINAIARMGSPKTPVTAYVNRMCCSTCAKALASANVKRIVCKKTNIDGHIDTTTIENFLYASGVEVVQWEETE